MITRELKPILLSHIRANAVKKEIFIDSINCVEDHIHLLISLSVDQTLSKTIQLLKGESSFWVNSQNISKQKFEWQDDYIAFSVSESGTDAVRQYIDCQEEHHRKKTFMEEYDGFLKLHGFSNDFG